MKFALQHVKKNRYGFVQHKSLDPLPLKSPNPDAIFNAFCRNKTVLANPEPADVYHPSYAYYLLECWANHYGAVVTAEMLWFSALTTFARLVANNAEEFRPYFVDFQGRRKIEFIGESDDTAVADFIQLALPLIKLDLINGRVFHLDEPQQAVPGGCVLRRHLFLCVWDDLRLRNPARYRRRHPQ